MLSIQSSINPLMPLRLLEVSADLIPCFLGHMAFEEIFVESVQEAIVCRDRHQLVTEQSLELIPHKRCAVSLVQGPSHLGRVQIKTTVDVPQAFATAAVTFKRLR